MVTAPGQHLRALSDRSRAGMRKALRGHPRRYLAAALAMALGVAFVASTLLVIASARSGIEAAVGGQYERADVVVIPTGPEPDRALLETIRAVAGVEAVATTGTAYAQATWTGSARPHHVTIDVLADDPSLQWHDVVDGALPTSPDQIAIESERASSNRLGVGSTITVTDADGAPHDVTVVALYAGSSLTDSGYAMSADGAHAVDPYATAGEVLVRGADGVNPASLAVAIADAVGPEWLIATAEEHVSTLVAGLTGDVDVLGRFLLAFAVVALLVAALVIANTFVIVLAQRTRELALLRCVGAGRGQLFRSVIARAATLGVVAGTAGLLGGVGLAAILVGAAGRFSLPFPITDLAVGTTALVAPVLVGLLVAVGAALLPAIRATKVAPVAALQPAQSAPVRSRAGAARAVAALGALGLGVAMLGVGAAGGTLVLGLAGGALTFVAVLIAGPVLLPALVRMIGYVPARLGLPARLARVDAVRNPGRAAATSSALLIGVTLIATMTVGAASMERSVAASLDSELPVDLVVDAAGQPLPAGLVADVGGLDDIASVVGLHGAPLVVDGVDVSVLGVDPAAGASVVRGPMLDDLRDGVVLVPGEVASSLGIDDGDRVAVGGLDLVAAQFYGLPSLDLVITADDLARLRPEAPLAAVWARATADAAPSDLVDATQGFVADLPDAEVSGGLAERAAYQGIFDVMLLVATVLLAVAVLIALVGVGNTVSLSVLERAREHGLLRALGLRRSQLAAMLGTEAALLALAAAVLGLGLGIGYGFAGTMTVLGRSTDDVVLSVPWGQLLVLVAVATLAGLLAAVLPARRAAGTAPVVALGRE